MGSKPSRPSGGRHEDIDTKSPISFESVLTTPSNAFHTHKACRSIISVNEGFTTNHHSYRLPPVKLRDKILAYLLRKGPLLLQIFSSFPCEHSRQSLALLRESYNYSGYE